MADFLPPNYIPKNLEVEKLEGEKAVPKINDDHEAMMIILNNRSRLLNDAVNIWRDTNFKNAIKYVVSANDLSTSANLIEILLQKQKLWDLDLCNLLLSPIGKLLEKGYERYLTIAGSGLKFILGNFGPLIRRYKKNPLFQTTSKSQKEQYHKCLSCVEKLSKIRTILSKTSSDKYGDLFRRLEILIKNLE